MLLPVGKRGAFRRVAVVSVCIVSLWGAADAVARQVTQAELKERITRIIAKVRELSGPTIGISNARSEAAEQLPLLTKRMDPTQVDDQTLGDLVSLLDTWDDSVRAQVAASLGNLGPRARAAAAPKLLEILPEVDCLAVDLSSEGAIRSALERMGETPPSPPVCEEVVGLVLWKQRIAEAISTVRVTDSAVNRGKAAFRVRYLMSWLGPEQIDDGTIADLVSLLDIPDQAVRDAVAGALGEVRDRAKESAGPKLQELLAEVDCRSANQGSAEVIREALSRIGVKASRQKCGMN